MSRATAHLSMMLGAGFSTLSTVITDLTVYDGPTGLIALIPVAFAVIVAVDELQSSSDDDDLPDGLTEHEVSKLREGTNA
jgi:hypothetical protein